MKVVARLLDDLEAEMRRTADTPSIDAVHDLRVSVRRATEGIRIFTPESRRLRRQIKAIRERAAAVRDRDVTRHLLHCLRLPPSDPACIYLEGQRALAASQLQEFLTALLGKDCPARWRRWIAEPE